MLEAQDVARGNLLFCVAPSPLRVKLRRTQCEQMSSELPLKADIAQYVGKVMVTWQDVENDVNPQTLQFVGAPCAASEGASDDRPYGHRRI